MRQAIMLTHADIKLSPVQSNTKHECQLMLQLTKLALYRLQCSAMVHTDAFHQGMCCSWSHATSSRQACNGCSSATKAWSHVLFVPARFYVDVAKSRVQQQPSCAAFLV